MKFLHADAYVLHDCSQGMTDVIIVEKKLDTVYSVLKLQSEKNCDFTQIAANHSLLNLFKGKLKPMKNKIL